jgi:hypothetical protein
MPPKAKDSKKNAKQGTPLKEIIPPTIKQPPRDPKVSKNPEYVPNPQKINEYVPQSTPEDWPGDEIASTFDFGVESGTLKPFTDQTKFPLPPSLRPSSNAVIFWRRPKELLKNEAGNQGFGGFAETGRSLQRKKTVGDLDSIDRKKGIFHNEDIDYSSPSSKKEEVAVELFQVFEREETPEEVEKRIKDQAEAAAKAKKKGGKKEEVLDTPQKVNDVKLSNIDLKNDLPAYAKWIASQLQLIKDRNIRDAHVYFLYFILICIDQEAYLEQSLSSKRRSTNLQSFWKILGEVILYGKGKKD